jgi:hypothetical protein
MMRSLGVLAGAAGGFVLGCLLIDQALPREFPAVVREKLAHLAAHRGEYDTLFLGSSRMESHIIPALFDRLTAQQGASTKSFNFGVPGMCTPQDAYLLDRILETKPRDIRWVFVELQSVETVIPPGYRDTMEQVYWHDWPRFTLLCRRFIAATSRRRRADQWREMRKLWPSMWDHTWQFANRMTNLGRGAILLNRWVGLEPSPPMRRELLGENGDGYRPTEIPRPPTAQETAALESNLQKQRAVPASRDPRDSATQLALDRIVARIRQAGATPVLVIPPNATRGSYFYPSPQSAAQLIILDFWSAQKYPELYDLQYRVDTSHLTPAGAEIFTRLLAERFLETTKQGPKN